MAASELEAKPFFQRICEAPLVMDGERVAGALADARKSADASAP